MLTMKHIEEIADDFSREVVKKHIAEKYHDRSYTDEQLTELSRLLIAPDGMLQDSILDRNSQRICLSKADENVIFEKLDELQSELPQIIEKVLEDSAKTLMRN